MVPRVLFILCQKKSVRLLQYDIQYSHNRKTGVFSLIVYSLILKLVLRSRSRPQLIAFWAGAENEHFAQHSTAQNVTMFTINRQFSFNCLTFAPPVASCNSFQLIGWYCQALEYNTSASFRSPLQHLECC